MDEHGPAPEDIPVLSAVGDQPTRSIERSDLWQSCVEHDRPYLAIEDTEHGLAGIYDMSPLDVTLTESACREIQRVVDAHLEAALSQEEHEDLVIVVGRVNGKIFPLPQSPAREMLAEIAPILTNAMHWTDPET